MSDPRIKLPYDVVVVGGSYAGLSTAMTLGRSLRRVAVFDTGKPCNRYADHAHNVITLDGTPPADLAAAARRQVGRYDSVELRELAVEAVVRVDEGFLATTADGHVRGKRIVLATGVLDTLPKVPGTRACWGKSLIHCPYCHGYEFAHETTGVWSNSAEHTVEFARLVRNWTGRLTVFSDGPPVFDVDALASHDIELNTEPIISLQHEAGHVQAIHLASGATATVAVVYYGPPVQQHSAIPAELGCDFTPAGHIAVDPVGRTSVDGEYAVGDCATPARAISVAMASGTMAGSVLNQSLLPTSR